jgi:hypothetical protein
MATVERKPYPPSLVSAIFEPAAQKQKAEPKEKAAPAKKAAKKNGRAKR